SQSLCCRCTSYCYTAYSLFFFKPTATTEIYTLSLHDALPIYVYDLPNQLGGQFDIVFTSYGTIGWLPDLDRWGAVVSHFLKPGGDRKSTRLNSSHVKISYAVFCLKKKKKGQYSRERGRETDAQ